MWECAGCGQEEASRRKLDGVCHHCGLLLCPECRIVLIDSAFSGPLIDVNRTAVHCRDCWRQHHVTGVPLGRSTPK
jgi:hypothetical protein